MKTAISIPDELFRNAERLARRTRKSRSRLFSEAIQEYVARHDPEEVTATIDRVVTETGNQTDRFVAAAARRALERSDW